MLVLCYGITKSGSTLAFELIKGMLESAGHPQQRLPDEVVNPGHNVNYIQPLTQQRIDNLISAIGDRRIAVKTHAGLPLPLFRYLEELQLGGQLQVIISWRDPRDICLSLIDAAEQARETGRKEFSRLTDLQRAANEVSSQILKFTRWAALRNAVTLEYDIVAFSPDDAIEQLEGVLKIASDRECAKQHAFEHAFTQKNKGLRQRFLTELDEEQKSSLDSRFAMFLQHMYEGDSTAWLATEREEMLRKHDIKAAGQAEHRRWRAGKRKKKRRRRERPLAA